MNVFLKKGDIFSGCKILALCGKGAYGAVYLAENAIGQKVAIKIVTSTGIHAARELQGIKSYMQLSGTNPDLLRIFHVGDLPDGFYYTMELADDCGRSGNYFPATLGNLMRLGKRFSPAEAVKITRELLHCISAMHHANLLHRDIKPDNIIFVNGIAKLSDPGLCIIEGENATFAGTPGFIPPEVIEKGIAATRQHDLYAIGKVFYCMVTGNHPRRYPEFPDEISIPVRRQIFPALAMMCNRNPEKRFRTAEEFLRNLPEIIKPPTGLEQLRIDLRAWRQLNRRKFNALVIVLTLLLLCAAGMAAWMKFKNCRRMQYLKELHQSVQIFYSSHIDDRNLLRLQLEAYFPELLPQYNSMLQKLQLTLKTQKYDQIKACKNELQKFLRTTARQCLPEIPEKSENFSAFFKISGAARSFLATPLAQHLPPDLRKNYLKKLTAFEKIHYDHWNGPRCSGPLSTFNVCDRPLLFVPSGAVRLRHNRKVYKIPYHFWIFKHELLHKDLTKVLGIAPQFSPRPDTPAERISWNDILFYCWRVTRFMQTNNLLPPGYIVRPPDEAEWEYAASNAWLGEDTTPLAERAVIRSNSKNRSHAPGTRKPNKLGLWDIYGNVAEIVLPIAPTAMQHAVIVRGGSFKSSEQQCFRRIEYLPYQSIPYDIGFRPVIAPGDMEYFDRHFFLSGAMQTRLKGKIYEIIGGNVNAFTWRKAYNTAKLLGGDIVEFEDKSHLDSLLEKLPLAASNWGCFIGAHKVNGQWIWIRRQQKIDFGIWCRGIPSTMEKHFVFLKHRHWHAVAANRHPIFICEWDETKFHSRNDQLKSGQRLPGEICRFTAGNRQFMLINCSTIWHSAKRICELLGGRIACLDTPELRKEVIKKLKNFSRHKIMLGGYAKRDKWYWLSGKTIGIGLVPDPDMQIPSANRNFVILKNGTFFNGQFGQLLLCEWQTDFKNRSSN